MAPISCEIRKLILHEWVHNKLSYRRLAKKFNCSKTGVEKIIRKFGEHCTLENLPKNRSKKGAVNSKKEQIVLNLLMNKKTVSVREIARKARVSVGTVQNIKSRHGIKTYKKQKIPKRSVSQQLRAKNRAKKLYKILLEKKLKCLMMDDETYIKMDLSTLPGLQYYNAKVGSIVPDEDKAIRCEKFGSKILVWQAICSCGRRSTPYFTTGTINAQLYREECLKKRLLPFYRKHDHSPVFWPDLATAHYAKDTINFMKCHNIDFIEKEDNPPNCPNLRPIERYWAIMKRILRKDGREIQNVDEFKKIWNACSKKIRKECVQTLMGGVRRKVRLFYRG